MSTLTHSKQSPRHSEQATSTIQDGARVTRVLNELRVNVSLRHLFQMQAVQTCTLCLQICIIHLNLHSVANQEDDVLVI